MRHAAMPRRPDTEPATLADLARENINVWAWCESCCHNAVIETSLLIARLGPASPVPDLARHLRCSACGSRDLHARPDWPSLGVVARH